jgi:hypothetical protein
MNASQTATLLLTAIDPKTLVVIEDPKHVRYDSRAKSNKPDAAFIASVRILGVTQPLAVFSPASTRAEDGTFTPGGAPYEVLQGRKRRAAAIAAGKTVDVVVHPLTVEDTAEIQALIDVENEGRTEPNPLARVERAGQLYRSTMGLDADAPLPMPLEGAIVEVVAAVYAVTATTCERWIKVGALLTAKGKALVASGDLPVNLAAKLAIRTAEDQDKLIAKCTAADGAFDSRKLDALTSNLHKAGKPSKAGVPVSEGAPVIDAPVSVTLLNPLSQADTGEPATTDEAPDLFTEAAEVHAASSASAPIAETNGQLFGRMLLDSGSPIAAKHNSAVMANALAAKPAPEAAPVEPEVTTRPGMMQIKRALREIDAKAKAIKAAGVDDTNEVELERLGHYGEALQYVLTGHSAKHFAQAIEETARPADPPRDVSNARTADGTTKSAKQLAREAQASRRARQTCGPDIGKTDPNCPGCSDASGESRHTWQAASEPAPCDW